MTSRLSLRVLGPLEVSGGDGSPMAIGRGRATALLASLVLHDGTAVPWSTLARLVWGDRRPAEPRRALRALVRRQPAVLRDRVDDGTAGLSLHTTGLDIDARRFDDLVDRATSGRLDGGAAAAEEALDTALALWRGEPYPELAHATDALPEIERLKERRLVALGHALGLRLGRSADYVLVADLRSLTASHPERERFWRQLAAALYLTGREAEALRALHECRSALADLGVVPAASTERLERAIYARELTRDLLDVLT